MVGLLSHLDPNHLSLIAHKVPGNHTVVWCYNYPTVLPVVLSPVVIIGVHGDRASHAFSLYIHNSCPATVLASC